MNLDEGYDFRMPRDIDCTTTSLIEGEFVVYVSTLKMGLRFPHPFVLEMLDGYNICVNQMTPNS